MFSKGMIAVATEMTREAHQPRKIENLAFYSLLELGVWTFNVDAQS